MPVNIDCTARHIVKAADQVDNRCFSRTRRPDQRNRFARTDLKAYIVKYLCILVIGKGYILKFHLTPHFRKLCHALAVGNLRLRVKYLKNTLRARNVRNQLIVEIAQVHNRVPEHRNIGSERHQCSDRSHLRAEHFHADIVHAQRPEPPAEIYHRSECIRKAAGIHKGTAMLGKQLIKGFLRFVLRGKTLDYAHPRHILMDKGIQVRTFLAVNLPARMGFRLHNQHADNHQRQRAHRRQREFPVFYSHNQDNRTDSYKVRNQGGHAVGEHIL